jgi:uncharacterized protein (TIGR02147 family)
VESYKQIILEEFDRRVKLNSRYSLRAFARDLSISPSHLSELMNGKHGLSRARAIRIAEKLKLDKEEFEFFCCDTEAKHGRSERSRKNAILRLAEEKANRGLKNISPEEFNVIRDWYHLAILEFLKLKSSKRDISSIALALKISKKECAQAMESLGRLGYIKINGKDIELQNSEIFFSSVAPSRDIRFFHKQILQRAETSIDEQDPHVREYSCNILAVDKRQMDEMKQFLIKMRTEFHRRFNRTESKDAVYSLAIQFFELTNPQGEK